MDGLAMREAFAQSGLGEDVVRRPLQLDDVAAVSFFCSLLVRVKLHLAKHSLDGCSISNFACKTRTGVSRTQLTHRTRSTLSRATHAPLWGAAATRASLHA